MNNNSVLIDTDGDASHWINSRTALPSPGSTVEILLGESDESEDGSKRGTCKVHTAIRSAEDWAIVDPESHKMLWVRYWRHVQ